MPRLDFDGHKLQALLVAIGQKLVPLIARRILQDSKKITNLVVMNSRDELEIEMKQMFLYLRKEQDLRQEDYDHFLGDLHGLLGLLEGLVSEKVYHSRTREEQDEVKQPHDISPEDHADEGSSVADYPKLQALIEKASDETTSSDLSLLLRLPETEAKSRMAAEAVTNFNNNNRSRYNDNSGSVQDVGELDSIQASPQTPPDKSGSKQDLESFRHSQQCFSSLLNALMEDIETSGCTFNHIAKFQIRDITGSSEATNGIQHKIFVSSCQAQDKWQETTCIVVPHLPSPQRNLKAFQSICNAIQDSLEDEQTLEIVVHASRTLHNSEASQITTYPPLWPVVSLEDVLPGRCREDPFTPYDKVMIARNLARALLRMYSIDIQNKEWAAGDIYFLFDSQEETVYEAYNPYIACSLRRLQLSKGANSGIPKKKFPILISFGKLLLEIALEKKVGPFNRRLDIALLDLARQDEVTEKVIDSYVKAIKECIEANKANDKEADKDEEEDQCRGVIVSAVFLLEKARTVFDPDARKDPNRPLHFKVSRAVESQHTAPKIEQPTLMHENAAVPKSTLTNLASLYKIGSAESSTGLYDGQKRSFGISDQQRVDWASDFFDRAEAFYEKRIMNLSNDRRIRIAILDTGVDENNVFIKGVRRLRNLKDKKDKPLKQFESFVEGPKGDSYGHGTNVAALILKIAPEADLYIAKISHDQEMDRVDQIVKAIEWARSFHVDIINMSFRLPKTNAAIQAAIESAETAGVIVFAAASNYGGNTSRAFPASVGKVLCIHAADGYGNPSGMNPSVHRWCENISTLGVAIPSFCEHDVFLEGTSYSTPVAAAIAANVLRFVWDETKAGNLTGYQRKQAFSREGMRNILLAMSEPRVGGGYDYVVPWRKMWHDDATAQDVVTKIKEALMGNIH